MRRVFGDGFVSGGFLFGPFTLVVVAGGAYCIDAVCGLVYGLTGLGMCGIVIVGSD